MRWIKFDENAPLIVKYKTGLWLWNILYVFCAFDQTGDGMYNMYMAFHCQKD